MGQLVSFFPLVHEFGQNRAASKFLSCVKNRHKLSVHVTYDWKVRRAFHSFLNAKTWASSRLHCKYSSIKHYRNDVSPISGNKIGITQSHKHLQPINPFNCKYQSKFLYILDIYIKISGVMALGSLYIISPPHFPLRYLLISNEIMTKWPRPFRSYHNWKQCGYIESFDKSYWSLSGTHRYSRYLCMNNSSNRCYYIIPYKITGSIYR